MQKQAPKPAQVIIKGIIELPQSDAILLLESGELLAQMGKTKEAFEVFVGVASLVPHSDVPCILLGGLYFSQKKYAQAMKEYERALERNPKSALAQAHIGECLLFQKKSDEAIVALNRAIEMEPKGLPATFAKNLLKAKELKIFDFVRS